MESPRTVLITGCSSGIGAALAREFHGRGHRVIATARRLEALRELGASGLRTIALDVNDPASIAAAVLSLKSETDHLDILINNAGYGQFGAVIDAQAEDLRRQFETNVIAPVMLARECLPLLRKSTNACIANVGSISGVVTTPFAGIYCASKAALHALSDAMRMELAPLGVRVVTLEPGGISSQFGATGQTLVNLPPESPYQPIASFVLARAKASQRGAMPVEDFARGVALHLLQAEPAAIYRSGAQSTRLPLLKRLLPTPMMDRKMQKLFGLSRLG